MAYLADIPNNTSVFVDANIFIYHFCGSGDAVANQCSDFLLKVENGQLKAFTSTFVIAETLHRAMNCEATAKTVLSPKGAMNKLRKKPELIKTLRQYSMIPEKIMEIGVQILIVLPQVLFESQNWRDRYGLVVNGVTAKRYRSGFDRYLLLSRERAWELAPLNSGWSSQAPALNSTYKFLSEFCSLI